MDFNVLVLLRIEPINERTDEVNTGVISENEGFLTLMATT